MPFWNAVETSMHKKLQELAPFCRIIKFNKKGEQNN